MNIETWIDLLEDTSETAQSLLGRGFDPLVVDSIQGVTKKQDQSYSAYLRECALPWISFYTKVSDTYANLTESLKGEDIYKVRKYSTQLDKRYKLRGKVEDSYGG